MISNANMKKVHDVLVNRLLQTGNPPSITLYQGYINPVLDSSVYSLIKQFNSTVKRHRGEYNFVSDFCGFTQSYRGVEFVFERVDQNCDDTEVQVSISPASIIDLLLEVSFADVVAVKEQMKLSLQAKDVTIKVTY